MLKDYNLSTLLTREEHNDALNQAMDLESDIQFFNLYISRNKKSKARFQLDFSYGCAKQFFELINTMDYSIRKLQKTMMEYKILSKVANQLADNVEDAPYSEETLKDIYEYFLYEYDIHLEEIIDIFVGCSFLSEKVTEKIIQIKNKI